MTLVLVRLEVLVAHVLVGLEVLVAHVLVGLEVLIAHVLVRLEGIQQNAIMRQTVPVIFEQADGSQVNTTHGSHIGSHIASSF